MNAKAKVKEDNSENSRLSVCSPGVDTTVFAMLASGSGVALIVAL